MCPKGAGAGRVLHPIITSHEDLLGPSLIIYGTVEQLLGSGGIRATARIRPRPTLLAGGHTHDLDNPMTPEQYKLALQLLALLEDDPEGQANCRVYGDWLTHLTDHCTDTYLESLQAA